MSSGERRGYVLFKSDDVDVLEYPPHMAGYFSLYGLRVRTANGRAHTAMLSASELRAVRDFLNKMDL